MTAADAIARLAEIAAREGIEVRVEALSLKSMFAALGGRSGRGGPCRVGQRWVVFVETSLPAVEQAGVLGEALGTLGIGVPEELRIWVEAGHGKVRALIKPRPLARGR
jgi:hypothetical protein